MANNLILTRLQLADKLIAEKIFINNLQTIKLWSFILVRKQCVTIIYSSSSSRIWLIALCFQLFIAFTERKKKVPFSMAIGNGELMHECFPKHLRMGKARMK